MGDDAEYYMEQQELEEREREMQRQARIDEDARRNRKWEKAAAGATRIPPKPKKR
ncbi:hypothetical protein [Nitrosomonas sp.]|uniref:hypothetical protein n=1 Tax=Nitrosomonas sp. TaxID=42353 RepID=UPI00330659E5